MSLDTKYRPQDYRDVLGQEATVAVLRQFVDSGRGFQQSYLFAGPKGCGKTTLGRILARSLLCEATEDGNPCNECQPCMELLSGGSPDGYTEMDAATNSGKDQIQEIVEQQRIETFSGRRRIYLIDECHRLSVQAMDGLLKSLEDTVPGSEDRVLVCIFCTTEPEKVRDTISSRCAPTFLVRQVEPAVIAERCALVCDSEGIGYDIDALKLIAEITGCHVRDALQAVSGVSALGEISQENVRAYLNLGASAHHLTILAYLGRDLRLVLQAADQLKALVSPATSYSALAEAAMTLYKHRRVGMGSIPSYWSPELVEAIDNARTEQLLEISSWFSKRPSKPTHSMFLCDLSTLHQRLEHGAPLADHAQVVVIQQGSAPVRVDSAQPAQNITASDSAPDSAQNAVSSADSSGTVQPVPEPPGETKSLAPALTVTDGIYRDERLLKNSAKDAAQRARKNSAGLAVDFARPWLLGRVEELLGGRPEGRTDMGDN